MKCLVIIDMVNGFVNEGALADKSINKITPNIIEMVKKAIDKNIPIIAFRDCHETNDEEFKTFPPHCIKGTSESQLIPELLPYAHKFTIIDKNTTNGFITNKFKTIVSKIDFEKVYITGCCTDICVEGFTNSYLKYIRQNNKNTELYVFKDAVATFDGVNHNAQEEHNNALERMALRGAKIVSLHAKEDIKE